MRRLCHERCVELGVWPLHRRSSCGVWCVGHERGRAGSTLLCMLQSCHLAAARAALGRRRTMFTLAVCVMDVWRAVLLLLASEAPVPWLAALHGFARGFHGWFVPPGSVVAVVVRWCYRCLRSHAHSAECHVTRRAVSAAA
ncbi:hypothetical protein COO60DRAFT_1555411 [Scenedesmus sp. NREL 46B-D3]|nr:hypothetical protein COO60DRAFT_1555411 [Scenedesmus sp. NREL 46B-D3]